MPLPLLTLPRAVPILSGRPTQDTVPPTREERERIRAWPSGTSPGSSRSSHSPWTNSAATPTR